MNKRILSYLLLLTQSLVLPLPSAAQVARTQGATTTATASVTFTFNSACEDCATQNSGAGESRFLVDVPASNNPSPAVSGHAGNLSLEARLKQDRLVYSFQYQPGTSPRAVWRQGGQVLQVFFVPAAEAASAGTNGSASGAAAADEAAVAPLTGMGTNGGAESPPVVRAAPSTAVSAAPAMLVAAQTSAATNLQETTKPINRDEPGSTDYMEVDLSVPESPAFTVLGLTPQTVVRPTSPRQFASSLLSGVDMNGNFQSGLALDFVPYLAFAGDELTLRGYQESYLTRLLARTQFSFATTKGASDDDKSMRLALGFHATLLDRGDPRMDRKLLACLESMRLPAPRTQQEPELLGTTPAEVQAFNEARTRFTEDNRRFERDRLAAIEFNNGVSTRCREQAQKDNWNRTSWIVAGAPSWISPTGETKNYEWNGGGFWTSLAYGFEGVPGMSKRSQLILHARYRNREQVANPDAEGEFITQDSTFFGARFRHGSPTFNGSFEYTFLRKRPVGESSDNSQRLALGFERRIAGDTWFNLSLGGETGRADGRNKGFVLTSFKWAFSDRKNVPAPEIR